MVPLGSRQVDRIRYLSYISRSGWDSTNFVPPSTVFHYRFVLTTITIIPELQKLEDINRTKFNMFNSISTIAKYDYEIAASMPSLPS